MPYTKSDEFINICYEKDFDAKAICEELKSQNPGYSVAPGQIEQRIANYRRNGKLPLDSGNKVSSGEILKSSSTLFDANGQVKAQWLKTDVPKEQFLAQFQEALNTLVEDAVTPAPAVAAPSTSLNDDLATMYISNDVHFGALMWDKESGKDWNLDLATSTLKSAYDYLLSCSPDSKIGIITDLGDLTEVDDYKNMTPHSGNILSVDSRYPKILRAAYESLIYGINQALKKHETVYFYNIAGNHDLSTGDAIREVVRVAFQNNPRVIVDEAPIAIKYHQHGNTLLQFAHGDGLKMKDAGEVMAHDCQDIFSSTKHRYAHFGHTHKDAVVDSRLCRAESHRNLAPLNHWAHHKGFRGPLGTMKSITYHTSNGEVSRSIYNVEMD